ncbi:MAG: Helix-turn-helix domain [Myxococcaceae bacterium]|nr:Helix-turn-helix domain [Myxococcaceae bacterium]
MTDTLSLRAGDENEFLNLRELAALLRVAPVTIYRLVARRALPVYRAFRKILFRREDVRQYLAARKQDVTPRLLWP